MEASETHVRSSQITPTNRLKYRYGFIVTRMLGRDVIAVPDRLSWQERTKQIDCQSAGPAIVNAQDLLSEWQSQHVMLSEEQQAKFLAHPQVRFIVLHSDGQSWRR